VDVQRLRPDEWAAVWAYLAGEVSLQALGKARRPGKPSDASNAYPLLARALRELYAGGRILDTTPCALSAVVAKGR